MMVDRLSEGVRTLLRSATQVLPANGTGIVRKDGPEHVIFTYADAFGLTAYRTRERDIPEAFKLHTGVVRVAATDLAANAAGLVESRVLHTGFSDEIRQRHAAQHVVTLPVPRIDAHALLVVGLSRNERLGAAEVARLNDLASAAVEFLDPAAHADGELELLRRLEAVEKLLPKLFRVLDVRQIFDRLSDITKEVLPHDFASLGIFSDDLTQVQLYAETSSFSPQGGPMPYPQSQTSAWLYRFVDDLTAHPLEYNMETVKVGGRSSLRVAIRLDDQILGAVNFTSRQTVQYSAADLVIGTRIADYLALALSHQRLADQARRNEELRAQSEKVELLEEMLSSVLSLGDLPTVFDRISSLTQKVVPHDAMIVVIRLPGGRQAKVYASSANSVAFPDVIEVPPQLLADPDWEFDLIDDLQAAPDQKHLWTTQHGYRATLRLPIRLDDEFAGGLSFFSFKAGQYAANDVPAAKRIADRIALTVARERGALLLRRADEAAERASKLELRVKALTEELDARTGYRRVVGQSKEWRTVLTQATQVAATGTTVLLLGESGTGKEVVARFVHRASTRADGPFIALNCAALPEHLLEAELFGYERGAFTGAVQSKPGQLEQASGGTLFLDEVGEMSLPGQAKFLRVLQEREFQRLGGTRVLRTDARVVAATNRDLTRAITLGQFREDLYYRLNVFAIQLPALRERPDDILPLSEAFLTEIGRGLGRPPAGISYDARKLLTEYHWPGNVRELRNILERAAILCDGGLITSEHFSLNIAPATRPAPAPEPPQAAAAAAASGPTGPALPSSAGDLESIERSMIENALEKARFNKSKAAKALGLTRQQLYARMHKYGLE